MCLSLCVCLCLCARVSPKPLILAWLWLSCIHCGRLQTTTYFRKSNNRVYRINVFNGIFCIGANLEKELITIFSMLIPIKFLLRYLKYNFWKMWPFWVFIWRSNKQWNRWSRLKAWWHSAKQRIDENVLDRWRWIWHWPWIHCLF